MNESKVRNLKNNRGYRMSLKRDGNFYLYP